MIRFCYLLFSILFFNLSISAQNKFDVLKGNSEEILATYLDRDSAMLFAYDKAGGVVVWDVDNMVPIRRFNIVPSNIWKPESILEVKTNVVSANKNAIWVGSQIANRFDGRNGSYVVYDRQSGKQIGQSDTTSATTFIHLISQDERIEVYCTAKPKYQQGKLVYGKITYWQKNVASKSFDLPMLVTAIKVSDDNQLIALGYRNGLVDVHELQTFEKRLSSSAEGDKDKILQIAFLKDNKGIAYGYEVIGSDGIYIHRFGEDQPKKILLAKDQKTLKVEVSPSGNYLAIYNPYKLGIYDFQKGNFVTTTLLDSAIIKPNAVSFLTDDVLLLAGTTFSDINDLYGIKSYSKSALFKLNWQMRKSSVNFSYDDLNRGFLDSKLTLLNDSTFKISGGIAKKFQHIIDNSRLSNLFTISNTYPSVGNVIENDANSEVTWYMNWEINEYYSLYRSTKESAFDTVFVTQVKKMPNFTPLKIQSDVGLILWKSDDFNTERKMLITDYKGKIQHSFQVQSLYEYSGLFSTDGKSFAYQKNGSSYVVSSTTNFQPKVINTGLMDSDYEANRFYFDQDSKHLAYRSFNKMLPNAFTYMVRDLKTEKTDTLCKIGMIPYGFGLSPDFSQMAISVPLNFADAQLFSDQKRMVEAARYGFKNLYQPTIILIDIRKDSIVAAIKSKNNLQASQLLVAKNTIIALQDDGLIYHYKLGNGQVITQWLFGNEQVLYTDEYYYATPKIIDRITLNLNNSLYPIGEQDRFFNKPQQIMRDFGSRKIDLINLYNEAYNKRINQYEVKSPAKSFQNLAQLKLSKQILQDFYTADSVLRFTVSTSQGAALKNIFVKVNGYSIYGKNGLPLKPNQKDIALQVPLDSKNNEITIQATDVNNRYIKPVRLNYFANYKVASSQKGRLIIISAGVSKYADTTYNLKYAAKDAVDFTKVFGFKTDFEKIIVKTLTNEQVTVQNISTALKSIGDFKRSDLVITFLAGHGMLDDRANFYFATHDMDFKNPAANGLSYNQMLEQLEDLPARFKMLVVDACHSGLVDRSRFTNKPQHQTADGKISLQDQRGVTVSNTGKGTHKEEDVFRFMQKVFGDLSYDNQVNILSASLGNSYALENDSLQNGLFTYAFIKGLGLAMADPIVKKRKYGEDSFISLPNLETYLNREVRKLSDGKQTPTFTSSYYGQYIFFKESFTGSYTFDSDYKPTDMSTYKPSTETLYKQFLDRYKVK